MSIETFHFGKVCRLAAELFQSFPRKRNNIHSFVEIINAQRRRKTRRAFCRQNMV